MIYRRCMDTIVHSYGAISQPLSWYMEQMHCSYLCRLTIPPGGHGYFFILFLNYVLKIPDGLAEIFILVAEVDIDITLRFVLFRLKLGNASFLHSNDIIQFLHALMGIF